MSKRRNHVDDLRGAGRLAVEATQAITDLVQAMHVTISSGPAILGQPLQGAARRVTRPVYGGIRAVTQLVGTSVDAALEQLAGLVGESTPRPEHEAFLAVLNGVLGDYLQQTDNPLAIRMHLRHDGQPLVLQEREVAEALSQAGSKLAVLVHGSCMTDHQWSRQGHDHGAALARDLGTTPIYLNYNSGLHVSTNGRAFARLLDQLVAAWPVPLEEIIIVAHSMGGLVARSACHYAEVEGQAWRPMLRKLVCLGCPHHGAPLERGGNWIDALLGLSRYSAPLARLGQIRSAGVTDMRFGSVLDDDWHGCDRFAFGTDCRTAVGLPGGVQCYTIAGTTAPEPCAEPPGDGIVPVDSALGRCERSELTLEFPDAHQWIAHRTRHLDLLDRPEVYEKLVSWLA